MLESSIERTVCEYAKSLGWLCYKFVSPGNAGVPDRIFFGYSRVILIEFKSTGKKPRPLQAHVISKLRKVGTEVHVIDNVADGKRVFTSVPK